MNKIAVLMTSFNRKEKTISCLQRLFELNTKCDVYLVDDNSSDGTYDAISKKFPEVNLISGSGNLYWNRGMHLAWQKAESDQYDFYLWLNDDVILFEKSIDELLSCSKLINHKGIISGIIIEEKSSKVLYGGRDEEKKLIAPNSKMNSITHMNGNVVLVPKSVFKRLKNLDPIYHHDLGDVDYGYRAKENNINVFTSKSAVAFGEANPICRVRLNNSNIIGRFKRLYSPLGSRPKINFYFREKHFGLINAIIYFIFLHILNFIPNKVNNALFGTKYN